MLTTCYVQSSLTKTAQQQYQDADQDIDTESKKLSEPNPHSQQQNTTYQNNSSQSMNGTAVFDRDQGTLHGYIQEIQPNQAFTRNTDSLEPPSPSQLLIPSTRTVYSTDGEVVQSSRHPHSSLPKREVFSVSRRYVCSLTLRWVARRSGSPSPVKEVGSAPKILLHVSSSKARGEEGGVMSGESGVATRTKNQEHVGWRAHNWL